MLHTLNGFLAAGVGLSLVNILNDNSSNIKLSPLYITVFAFCFSMTIGVLWEFIEFACDRVLNSDMQKDFITDKVSSVEFNDGHITKVIDNIEYTILYDKNDKELYKIEGGYLDIGLIDTMEDLIVNFVGSITFCLLWYFDIRKIDGFLNKHFVPVKK